MIRAACRENNHDGCPGTTWGGCECICHEFAAPGGERAWVRLAACRGVRTVIFFKTTGDNTYSEARAICADCPVRADCLETHLGEKFGFWGGMSEGERRRERRTRAGLGPLPIHHGTTRAYQKHSCRCDPCRVAQRDYAATHRARTA